MPDLDLAAIRSLAASWRRWEKVAERPSPYAEDLADACDRLLAVVDELTTDRDRAFSELRQLADRLREAVAERDRLRVSRDDWRAKALGAASMQRFVIGGDCCEPGCRGERVDIAAFGRADPVAVVLDCGHELPAESTAPEPPAEADPQPES